LSKNLVLVTGGNGFIGSALSEKLAVNPAFHVRVAARTPCESASMTTDFVRVGDIGEDCDWSAALQGVDCVVHTAARVHVMNDTAADPLAAFRQVNLLGTMQLARQAADAGVRRFIFISSIKVNGEQTKPGSAFHADDQPNPSDPYGVSKAEAEQALLVFAQSSNMTVVIIRPVLVYGPGVKANFHNMIKWVNSGVPLPFGAVDNRRSFISIDNLIDLIVTCIHHPGASNQIFLASDGQDVSTTKLLELIADALDRPSRLVPIPSIVLYWGASLVGLRSVAQRVLGSLQVDVGKNLKVLGWRPVYSVEEGVKRTVRPYRQSSRS
jgi:nucleoside-diphosphate-sugar epimerase